VLPGACAGTVPAPAIRAARRRIIRVVAAGRLGWYRSRRWLAWASIWWWCSRAGWLMRPDAGAGAGVAGLYGGGGGG
jgi:hypothetical protein